MPERSVNPHLVTLLESHSVRTSIDNEVIHTNLPGSPKFTSRVVYQEFDNGISSRLDVMVMTANGETIFECFGDVGSTVDEAITRNFQNFSSGALHPILAALGSEDPETIDQVGIEEWVVNERTWKVYLGNLVPKSMCAGGPITPPAQFFQSIEKAIRSQKLTNGLHWFRSYYCQVEGKIADREFLMDNEAKDAEVVFSEVPVLPEVEFFSCRHFCLVRAI